MKYADMLKLYRTKLKSRDYKVMCGGGLALFLADDGTIKAKQVLRKWTINATTKKYERLTNGFTTFASITQDDVLTLDTSLDLGDITSANQLHKLSGFGWARSCAGSHKRHRHKYRFFSGDHDVPLTAGFKLDLANRKVLYHVPDEVATTNRNKAKPVYEHTKEVMRMMDVLYRLGELQLDHPSMRGITYWELRREKLAGLGSDELSPEAMAGQAEEAFISALVRVRRPRMAEYGDVDIPGGGTSYQIVRESSKAELDAEHYARVRKLAKVMLREELKKRHECFDVEVVNQ